MAEIYLMPIGSEDAVEHMYNTLLNPVQQIEIASLGVSVPDGVYSGGGTNVWSLVPGKNNERQWSKFSEGDFVIFVPTNYNLIVTQITYKVRNQNLAQSLWGNNSKGQTWELVFFVKVLGFLAKDKRTLLTELGYSSKDNLPGTRRVTKRFQNRYGSVDAFLSVNSENKLDADDLSQDIAERLIKSSFSTRTKPEERLKRLEEIIKRLGATPREYVEINGKRIRRNHLFVAYVKERDGYRCKVCGFTFTKRDGEQYVEVAHIVGLAKGGEDKPENMVALCANCHKKLDKGNEEARNEIIEALKNKGFKILDNW
ncbi:MAG: HNH endonuclease [Desulfurococcaceae archaeon]